MAQGRDTRNAEPTEPAAMDLHNFTKGLIQDLESLRAGEITNADARTRAQLAREVLRSAHLQLQGMRFLAGQAKALPAVNDTKKV